MAQPQKKISLNFGLSNRQVEAIATGTLESTGMEVPKPQVPVGDTRKRESERSAPSDTLKDIFNAVAGDMTRPRAQPAIPRFKGPSPN